jgi:hypothetical protein
MARWNEEDDLSEATSEFLDAFTGAGGGADDLRRLASLFKSLPSFDGLLLRSLYERTGELIEIEVREGTCVVQLVFLVEDSGAKDMLRGLKWS